MSEYFGKIPYPEWDEHVVLQGKVKALRESLVKLKKNNAET